MFADPLALNNASLLSYARTNAGNRAYVGTEGIPAHTLTINQTPTKENPAAGGSTRHLVRVDIPVYDGDSNHIGNVSVMNIVVVPNSGADAVPMAKIAQQTILSLLLAETDGSLSIDATLDDSTFTRLLAGEA